MEIVSRAESILFALVDQFQNSTLHYESPQISSSSLHHKRHPSSATTDDAPQDDDSDHTAKRFCSRRHDDPPAERSSSLSGRLSSSRSHDDDAPERDGEGPRARGEGEGEGSGFYRQLQALPHERLAEEAKHCKHQGDQEQDSTRRKAHHYLRSAFCWLLTVRKMRDVNRTSLLDQTIACIVSWSKLAASDHEHFAELSLFQAFLAYAHHTVFAIRRENLSRMHASLLKKCSPSSEAIDLGQLKGFLERMSSVFNVHTAWITAITSSDLIRADEELFPLLLTQPEQFLIRTSLLLHQLEEKERDK